MLFLRKLCDTFFIFLLFMNLVNIVLTGCGCNKKNIRYMKLAKKNNEPQVLKIEDNTKHDDEMSLIQTGEYIIGTNTPIFTADRETPERVIKLNKFYIDKYEVSNSEFKKFVESSKYITEAEIFGDSFVFQNQLTDEVRGKYKDFRVVNAVWWFKINGTSWKHPDGPESNINDRDDLPVVHVSWNDAVAYCAWKNKRLPTENEWEAACRGAKKRKLYPWGNSLMPKKSHWMNIWQGEFPDTNTGDDGYPYLCPVNKFRQNDYDLYNIVGNVWEWTSDLWNVNENEKINPERVRKGGSYLCHESYCFRYRCAARSQNTEDSSADNLGFRCAKDFDEHKNKHIEL